MDNKQLLEILKDFATFRVDLNILTEKTKGQQFPVSHINKKEAIKEELETLKKKYGVEE